MFPLKHDKKRGKQTARNYGAFDNELLTQLRGKMRQ